MRAKDRLLRRAPGVLVLLLALAAELHATAPALLTYQGRLKESGLPVTAARNVLINICDSLTAGTCTPSPSGTQSVSVVNGLFRTTFTVPSGIALESGAWYLEVSVGGSPFSPREMLSANPYSIYASSAATLIANPGANYVVISTPVNLTAKDSAGYSLVLSSGINAPLGTVKAGMFIGDGSGLTGIPPSPDNTKVDKAGSNMTGALNIIGANLTLVGPTANIVTGASVTASAFYGNGAGLTNLPAAGGAVAKIGDGMTGPLTMLTGSTITVGGNAFSVGGTTLAVVGGQVGIGLVPAPISGNLLDVEAPAGWSAIKAGCISSNCTAMSGATNSSGGTGVSGYSNNVTNAVGVLGQGVGSSSAIGVAGNGAGWDFYAQTVGGKSYFAGNVGIGATFPATLLDVNGSAQFGSGASKSTFTALGSLLVPYGVTAGSVTLAGGLTASSATFTQTGNSNFSLQTSSGISVPAGAGVYAGFFVGNGAGLTGLSGVDPSKVAKSGDVMTGNLFLNTSTLTVNGPIFSTGTSGAAVFSGAGTRFMWVPAQQALRAGSVSSTQWDSANIGANSVAFGANTIANNTYATVSGGFGSTASGLDGTVGGGLSNQATGAYSTVPGGANNLANGLYSFAAGNRAKANMNGGFVWADSQNADATAFVNDQFLVRAQGGFVVQSSSYIFANSVSTYVYIDNTGLAMATGSSITLSGSGGVIVTQSSITAGKFYGDGSGLINVGAVDATKVAKAGDTMTGQLTLSGSTLTVTGSAFSVGGTSFTVAGGSATLANSLTAGSVYSLGNAGIGTVSPATKLHMSSGTLTIDGTSPAVNISTQALISNAMLQVGNATMTVLASGSVGIGLAGPTRLLHVSGTSGQFRVDNTATGGYLFYEGSTFGVNGNLQLGAGGGNQISVPGQFVSSLVPQSDNTYDAGAATQRWSKGYFRNVETSTLTARVGDTGIQVATSIFVTAGNIGIGMSNTASKLHVLDGDIRISTSPSAVSRGLIFQDGTVQTTAAGAAGGGWTKSGAIIAQTTPTDNVVLQSTLTVQGNAFSVGGSTFVVSNGNVGIGLPGPGARLHVSAAGALATDTVFLVSSGPATGQELLSVKGGGRVGVSVTTPTAALDIKGVSSDPAVAVFRDFTGTVVASVTAGGIFAGTQQWAFTLYDPQGMQLTDNIPSVLVNRLNTSLTITEVYCASDDSFAKINLHKASSAGGTNILTTDLTCGVGTASTIFLGSENQIGAFERIDYLMQALGSPSAKRINVVVKYVLH